MIRCHDCGFESDEADEIAKFKKEGEDYRCPECGEDCCFEFREMTEEEEASLEEFLDAMKKHGIRVPGSGESRIGDLDEVIAEDFLWEDYRAVSEIIEKEKPYIYTLIECEDDEAWINEGCWLVNRMGYFLSREKIEIKDSLRYW